MCRYSRSEAVNKPNWAPVGAKKCISECDRPLLAPPESMALEWHENLSIPWPRDCMSQDEYKV